MSGFLCNYAFWCDQAFISSTLGGKKVRPSKQKTAKSKGAVWHEEWEKSTAYKPLDHKLEMDIAVNTLTRWSEPCDPSACCSAAACADDWFWRAGRFLISTVKYTMCIPTKSCFMAIFAYKVGRGMGEMNCPPTDEVLMLFTFRGCVTKVLSLNHTSCYNSPPAKKRTNPTQVKHLF